MSIKKNGYGVCFYPEHWDWKIVLDDFKRIVDCGFDFVRIGEGAWAYFEPEEGQYQFDLFDKVLDECRKNKLEVIFGTPTYCGPAWIPTKYPEVLRWDFNRTPMKHGSRRHFNYTSPRYLELSDKIVTALGNHYKREKLIKIWQIDNEFNCHMDVSYAPTDTLAFRAWLRNKYKTLDRFNDAWGTKFWSQTYSDWDQIDLPHPTPSPMNPTQLLDESRFISDTAIAYCRRQIDILKSINPNWQFTHNAVFNNIDGNALTKELDFFSHDQYPMFHNHWTGFMQTLVQSRSFSFPYAVLEQQSGPGGQTSYMIRNGRPGEMRLWAHQSLAHGAKMLSFFCWRTCPFGAEQHWHGLVDHDGKDNVRTKAAKQLGLEMKKLPKELWDAAPEKCVAIFRDYDNDINDRRINNFVKAGWEVAHWMSAFAKAHIPFDQVWTDGSLDGYKIVIAPHLKVIDKQIVDQYTSFVTKGGTLVIGAQSGTKDRNLHMRLATRPTLLRKLTGIEVDDWSVLKQDESRNATFEDNDSIQLTGFVERLRLRGATALATWTTDDDLIDSASAITINKVGKGQVIYVAAHLDEKNAGILSKKILSMLDITPIIQASEEVELVIRQAKKKKYLWLLNHTNEPQIIEKIPDGTELLTEKTVEGNYKLPPRGVAVILCKKG